jgi:hypothetical protein
MTLLSRNQPPMRDVRNTSRPRLAFVGKRIVRSKFQERYIGQGPAMTRPVHSTLLKDEEKGRSYSLAK